MGTEVDDLIKQLEELASVSVTEEKQQPELTQGEKMERLQRYASQPVDYKPGTFVSLNEFGVYRYKRPNPKRGEVGIVMDNFGETRIGQEDGRPVHGTIAVIGVKENNEPYPVVPFCVDFRCFEEAKKKK